LNSREGVTSSRRYQLRLSPPLASEVEDFARQYGLGLCGALRLLVGRGLAAGRLGATLPQETPATLATLMAAEHAVLMVASVLPDGQYRMHELGPEAAVAAEERLAMFREGGR
jgi:hypothetical protein